MTLEFLVINGTPVLSLQGSGNTMEGAEKHRSNKKGLNRLPSEQGDYCPDRYYDYLHKTEPLMERGSLMDLYALIIVQLEQTFSNSTSTGKLSTLLCTNSHLCSYKQVLYLVTSR